MQATRVRRQKALLTIPARVAERAITSVVVTDEGCWISTYSLGSHGYAQIGWHDSGRTRMTTAHRAAWVHAHGEQIPESMTVDHLCKQKRCVNPDHLRLLSNFENARRTSGRDWPEGECINGHPNNELRTQPSGKRVCRACQSVWNRRYIEKQQAASV